MLPLSDENVTSRASFLTVGLVIACVWIFFVVQPAREIPGASGVSSNVAFAVDYAAIPCEVTRGRALTQDEFDAVFEAGITSQCSPHPTGSPHSTAKHVFVAILWSMFLHGGIIHLVGNMLFLWVFGNNVEDRFGRLRFLLFYLAAGLISTVGHILAQPSSAIPIIGASGAIAGVMGAYLVLFPNARVHGLFFVFPIRIRAKYFLMLWFLSQFAIEPQEGIAWVAHVVGFVFGMAVAVAVRIAPAATERRVIPVGVQR